MTIRSAAHRAALCVLILAGRHAAATVLDPNWTESSWITISNNITGMAWAPDGSGRLFVILKEGDIRIVKSGPPPSLVPTPFATVSPIYTSSECGLIGIAFDPEFVKNGYVYVFATVSAGEQQIIRYTASGDLGSNKKVIVGGLPTAGANHDGGGVGFGADGMLYWSIGDNGNGTGVNADLTSLGCKVGRATVEGAVAPGNPFDDGPGPHNDYIWARGLRNPFTLTFQPTTGKLWLDVAGDSYEQVFAMSSADHAGYNVYENNQPAGFLPPAIKYRTNTTDSFSLAAVNGAVRSSNVVTFTTTAAHRFRQGEKITISGVSNSSFNGTFYVATGAATPTSTTFTVAQTGPDASSGGGTATTQLIGGAITGGAFYDATAATAPYRGNFFFGDYNSGRITRAVVGPGATVMSVDDFATGSSNNTDVSVGPDGALYYASIAGAIKRATFNAATQGLIVSNEHLLVNEGGFAAFTVRLATAPATNVTVNVARTAGSSDVSVAAGASLVFTPANFATLQTVTLSSVDDADAIPDTATVTVSSTGLASQSVEVTVTETTGSFGGTSPGAVPDGASVPGPELTVQKHPGNPANLDLDWSASCSPTATDYSVHEGTIGSWYSHAAIQCGTFGATQSVITPGAGSRYYLVVPLDPGQEGSYGKDSAGNERPRSSARCRSRRNTTSCP